MTEVDPRPSRSSLGLIATVGAVLPVVTAAASAGAAGLGVLAVAVTVAGAALTRRRIVDVGLVVAFASVVVAASADAPAVVVLAALVATVATWDVAGNALSLGDQLGRDASTFRVEALHALSSVTVGGVAATAGLAVFTAGPTGVPTAALFLLLAWVVVPVAIGAWRFERTGL
jgi:hypothetical protein